MHNYFENNFSLSAMPFGRPVVTRSGHHLNTWASNKRETNPYKRNTFAERARFSIPGSPGIDWAAQRSPTFGSPEQSCHGKFRKSEFLCQNISVICPESCRVTEIQITSCPSKKEFFTWNLISVICTGVVPRHRNHF